MVTLPSDALEIVSESICVISMEAGQQRLLRWGRVSAFYNCFYFAHAALVGIYLVKCSEH